MQEADFRERVRAGVSVVYGRTARQRRQKCELIRQRQHIKQPGAAADRHLSVAQGVPCKADTRFEILRCGMQKNGSPRGECVREILRRESLPAVSVGTEVIS